MSHSVPPPHPLLQRIPLVLSPLFRPPKAVAIDIDLEGVPQQYEDPLLAGEVSDQLSSWAEDVRVYQERLDTSLADARAHFEQWRAQMLRQAPGLFDDVVLLPRRQQLPQLRQLSDREVATIDASLKDIHFA